MTAEKMLAAAERDYAWVVERCEEFDDQLAEAARKTGRPEYADLCSLAYRQAIAAHKLVADADGEPLFFSKECFSNGSIGTVDVTYPSAPLFLLYQPKLLRGNDGADLLFQRERPVDQALRGPRRRDLSAGQRPNLSARHAGGRVRATC